jgi:hypothetical protein
VFEVWPLAEPERSKRNGFDRGSSYMQVETAPRPKPDIRAEREEYTQLPTWQNTRPRGNQEPDRRDLERSIEKLEMLLGR